MPDITQAVFSIAGSPDEYEDPVIAGEGGSGGGSSKVGSKTSKAIKQNIIANAQKNRSEEVKKALLKVFDGFPKFKSMDEESKFLNRYVGWVLACIEMDEVIIRDEDLEFDFFKSSGPGGQNVNKVNSGARAIHVPTNIAVENTKTPDQHKNKARAVEILVLKLESHIEDWKNYLRGDTSKLSVDFVKTLLLG